jgi:hypothetical protein
MITGSGLDLLTPSFTINLNYNPLQQLTINDFKTRSIPCMYVCMYYSFYTAQDKRDCMLFLGKSTDLLSACKVGKAMKQ